MVEISSRGALEPHLTTEDWTLLILIEDPDGYAKKVHDLAARAFKRQQTHRKPILLADTGPLTPDEETKWGLSAGRYVLLGRRTRRVVRKGKPVTDLMVADNVRASIRSIRGAFLEGDAG